MLTVPSMLEPSGRGLGRTWMEVMLRPERRLRPAVVLVLGLREGLWEFRTLHCYDFVVVDVHAWKTL